MARYVLTGGTTAFLHGKRVDVGQEFELPDDEKPPRFCFKLEDGQPVPEPAAVPSGVQTMSEMQVGEATRARASDQEPV
jgi:hypothetical protein